MPPYSKDENCINVIYVRAVLPHTKDPKLLGEFYERLLTRWADFWLAIWMTTGLPKTNVRSVGRKLHDNHVHYLWCLQHYKTAAELAEIMEDADSAVKWRAASDDIYNNAIKYLYKSNSRPFYKGIRRNEKKPKQMEAIDLSGF